MIPNALVVAFDKRVRFEAADEVTDVTYARPGTLIIPINDDDAHDDKPGWIVDGQQRSAAIREARIESFPVCVTAFITDSDHEQRSQFILVNSAKPLPKGLIYELLPATVGTLPKSLQARKFPALLLRKLNSEIRSPLYRKIQTPTTPEGIIKDNSILKMLESSLSDGALYTFRDPDTGEGDDEQMMSLLVGFWSAVSEVFNYAWDIASAQVPPYARRGHRQPRLPDGRHLRPVRTSTGPQQERLRRRPHGHRRLLPMDERLLGLRPRPAAQVERTAEHHARHPTPDELLALRVQEPRLA